MRFICAALWSAMLALPSVLLGPRVLLAEDSAPGSTAPAEAPGVAHHPVHRYQRHGSTLEARVEAMSKALQLDAAQQSQLRQVLENQRAEVNRIWKNDAVPAANRVAATRQESDKTADAIRALLTAEQRKKYNPARQPVAADPAGRSVEDWIQATAPKLP